MINTSIQLPFHIMIIMLLIITIFLEITLYVFLSKILILKGSITIHLKFNAFKIFKIELNLNKVPSPSNNI